MNYWHMQLHPDDAKSWKSKDIRDILKYNFIGCSGEPIEEFKKIKIGDIVLIRHGGEVLSLVKILSKPEETPTEIKNDSIWFNYYCNIEILEDYTNKYVSGKGWYIPITIQSISNDIAFKYITGLYNKYLEQVENRKMEKIERLLTYKKQIILQGPPGTGKTRMAKQIAKSMTQEILKDNPEEKIKAFFKNYKVTPDISAHRNKVKNLNKEFLETFKKEDLKKLKLDDYVLGTDYETFCLWIEYKLYDTGKYTGYATKGKIYWNPETEEYNKSGFVKDIENDKEAMKMVAKALDDIVSEKDKDIPFGKGFILKVLNIYHPEKYFPINSEKCIINFLKLMKIDYSGLDFKEKNKKVQDYYLKMKSKFNTDITSYEFMYFLFDNFDLKNEPIFKDNELVVKGETKIIQFHPSYTYEDFVRGIVAKADKDAKGIIYEAENKILAEFASNALKKPLANFVLIIDEINRANLSSVLGELIYALEYRYYYNDTKLKKEESQVESIYAIKNIENNEQNDKAFCLPENLYIIGTMNTADRSVGHIDYAVRRRFAFYEMLPREITELGEDFKSKLFEKVKALFTTDEYETKSVHLSEDFEPKDVTLGHSYFIQKYELNEDGEDDKTKPINFKLRLDYEIKPILREYVSDGILKKSALQIISELAI